MTPHETTIRNLITTWLDATAAGDTERVLSLMAEDVVFLTPGQPPMRGRTAFAEELKGLEQFRIEGHSEVQEIRVLGKYAYF